MDSPNPHPHGPARLKTLMKAAGLVSFRLDPTRRALLYSGRSRDWNLVVTLNEEWLHAYTIVCNVPSEPGLRARLYEAVLQANGSAMLAKFGIATHLMLELEYRAEHLDPDVVRNLTSYLYEIAEQHYPKIFRIVNGDETLDALAGALQIAEPTL